MCTCSKGRRCLECIEKDGLTSDQSDSYGVLAVDDRWIVVLPKKMASFPSREEAYKWMEENDG